MKKFAAIILLSVSLLSCTEGRTQVTLGKASYKIPSKYIVSFEPTIKNAELDDASNMIALSFSGDEELSHLAGENGWLPQSPISVMIYDKSVGDFKESSSKAVLTSDIDVVEFAEFYRLFEKQSNSRWKTIPKSGVDLETSLSTADYVASCTAMGSMRGIKSSHTEVNIPTSCKITISSENLVFRFTSSEKNMVENLQIISSVVFSRLESWKLTD